MGSKSRRFTYLTIPLGLLVLLGAGYAAFKDKALEQCYLWKLEWEDEDDRKAAAEQLGEMGSLRAVPYLMRQLTELEAKRSSAISLGWLLLGSSPASYQWRRKVWRSQEKKQEAKEWEKNWAGRALVNIGPQAIHGMIECLDREQPSTSDWVKESFVRMGSEGLPVLLDGMEGPKWYVRSQVADVLGRFEPTSEEIVRVLQKALHDRNDSVRVSAMLALGRIGPDAKEAVSDLVTIVGEDKKFVRQIAMQTLGEIGPNAAEAVPVLTELFDQDDVREFARRALRHIQDDE